MKKRGRKRVGERDRQTEAEMQTNNASVEKEPDMSKSKE